MSGAQTMKIYSIIARIEEELEESPRTKFGGSSNKRVVEIDRLFDLLGDLKVTIPRISEELPEFLLRLTI